MKPLHLLLLFFSFLFISLNSHSRAHPFAGAIVKHISSVLKWTTRASSSSSSFSSSSSSPRQTQHDGDAVEFESGYFVETLMEGNKLGLEPYTMRVSPEGDLLVVDSSNNNVVRITPPLSQYSRERLVAGSFQGYSGFVDGKPSDARFHHPKGVTADEKGNIYVADTSNLAIRKIGEAGVTTIAGGKSNIAGYRDGPSEDAKFSSDFDVQYIRKTCSLLVVDRGNAALRQIFLQQEDCNSEYNSISTSGPFWRTSGSQPTGGIECSFSATLQWLSINGCNFGTCSYIDIVMVFGAILAGYLSGLLQYGFCSSFSSKEKQASETQYQDHTTKEEPNVIVESLKEDPVAGWPSLGTLLSDLFKFSLEAIGTMFLNVFPRKLPLVGPKEGLNPLKDNLVMPEDRAEPPLLQKQVSSAPMLETSTTSSRPQKSNKPPKFKDSTVSSKHRSSKRQEYGDFYNSGEAPQIGSKVPKERTRHRHREKSGEVEPSPVDVKTPEYSDSKFDHYTFRSKYGGDPTYRY